MSKKKRTLTHRFIWPVFAGQRFIFYANTMTISPYQFKQSTARRGTLKRYVSLIALFLFSPLTLSNSVAPPPILTLGYVEMPPYSYTDDEGIARGHLIELTRQLAESIGYRTKPISVPPKRAVQMVASGEINLWFGLPTIAAYKDHVLVTEQPIDQLKLWVYSTKPMADFNGRKSFSGKKVVIIRGYSYGGVRDFIKHPNNHINFLEVSDHAQGLHVLTGRNKDYFLSYIAPNEMLGGADTSQLNSRILTSLDVYIMVYKQLENADQILLQMENAYRHYMHTLAQPNKTDQK